MGRVIMDGDGTIECAVAVRHPKPEESVRDIAVVSPCGACRENLLDFDRDAMVIVPTVEWIAACPDPLFVTGSLPALAATATETDALFGHERQPEE